MMNKKRSNRAIKIIPAFHQKNLKNPKPRIMPDEEIFDFTDSRFLSPPVANQRNFPEVAVVNIGGEAFVTPAPLLSPSPAPLLSSSPGDQVTRHTPTPQPIFQLPETVSSDMSDYPDYQDYSDNNNDYLSISTIKPFVHLGSPAPHSISSTPTPHHVPHVNHHNAIENRPLSSKYTELMHKINYKHSTAPHTSYTGDLPTSDIVRQLPKLHARPNHHHVRTLSSYKPKVMFKPY